MCISESRVFLIRRPSPQAAGQPPGRYTAVCTMPNLNPVPDSVENLGIQRRLIEETACIHVYPYGAITIGEQGEALSDLEGMAPT